MGKAAGFQFDRDSFDIRMNKGDTGSFWFSAARKSGAEWTEDDRMLFTVRNQQGEVMLQRFYRLDDQWGQGDGIVLIEFHNDDTDQWDSGQYNIEWRFDVDPVWDGTAPTGKCVNALTAGVKMVEGSIVRTAIQSTLTIEGIHGEI